MLLCISRCTVVIPNRYSLCYSTYSTYSELSRHSSAVTDRAVRFTLILF